MREQLPIGSTREQVQDYLVVNNIGYSFVERDNAFYALVPDVKKGLFVTGSLQIVIKMDAQERLKSLDAKILYTGP